MISILKCTWRSNFTFFLFFLLIIKYFTKLLFLDNSEPLKNNSFVKYLINSKKNKKKCKFDLKAHFTIDREIMLNGLDRLFRL